MSSGIYTAMMGARAQEHALETVNNNLANVNTPGFKRQATMFREIHNDVTGMDSPLQGPDIHSPVRFLPDDRIAGVMEERFTHFDQGPLRQTTNPFDLAIRRRRVLHAAGGRGSGLHPERRLHASAGRHAHEQYGCARAR
jgi:flagellar hook-basal body protein